MVAMLETTRSASTADDAISKPKTALPFVLVTCSPPVRQRHGGAVLVDCEPTLKRPIMDRSSGVTWRPASGKPTSRSPESAMPIELLGHVPGAPLEREPSDA
jgi:hypothetical protein